MRGNLNDQDKIAGGRAPRSGVGLPKQTDALGKPSTKNPRVGIRVERIGDMLQSG